MVFSNKHNLARQNRIFWTIAGFLSNQPDTTVNLYPSCEVQVFLSDSSCFWEAIVLACLNIHDRLNRGGGKRWGVAIGPEHCSLSFRSAQSRISPLTEMRLSLCQIRSRLLHPRNTAALGELDRQLRNGAAHWKFSLAGQRAAPEPGRESTSLQKQRAERLRFKAAFDLCRSHCASSPGRCCFYCIGYL